MIVGDHLTSEVTIKRLVPTDSGGLEAYETHLEQVVGMIQPLDDSFQEHLDSTPSKDFLFFTETRDIKENDLIVDIQTGNIYKVVGVEDYAYFLGRKAHVEVRIRLSMP